MVSSLADLDERLGDLWDTFQNGVRTPCYLGSFHLPQSNIDFSQNHLTKPLTCTKCISKGEIVLEKEKLGWAVIRLSPKFYERISKKAPFNIEIVCTQCGLPVPGVDLPT